MKDVKTKKKKIDGGGEYGAVRVADDGNAYSWQMDFGESVSEVVTKKNSLKRKEKRQKYKIEDRNELKTRKKDEQVPKKKQ